MGKEFVEYHSENGKIPYSASTLCFCLTQYARNYIKQERKLIANVDNKVRDAVLVDAINYLGAQAWCDFALYTRDLHDNRIDEEYVDPQALLTVIQNFYANYIFDQNLVESVLRNRHMNECREEFNANDGALVLIDFINYVANVNEYDRTFTIRDLYEKFKIQHHNKEMNQLKKFLESTNGYSEKLANGESIDSIFEEMAKEHNLKYVAEDGTYHYTDVIRNRVGQSKMHSWDAQEVDEEIYAMAYAYAKMKSDEQSQVQVIDKKILEMKKR